MGIRFMGKTSPIEMKVSTNLVLVKFASTVLSHYILKTLYSHFPILSPSNLVQKHSPGIDEELFLLHYLDRAHICMRAGEKIFYTEDFLC